MNKLFEQIFSKTENSNAFKFDFKNVTNYLKLNFKKYYNDSPEFERTLLDFTPYGGDASPEAREVFKKLIIKAKKELKNDEPNKPAFNYLFYRNAGIIIYYGFKPYKAKRREYNINLDITGTSELPGYVNAVYDDLLKSRKDGEKTNGISNMDLDKMGDGNLFNKYAANLSRRLQDLNAKLLSIETNKGVGYNGFKRKLMLQDPDTKKFYDKQTGKLLSDEEVRARISKKPRFISTDDTDIAGNPLVDTFMSNYIDSKKDIVNHGRQATKDAINIRNWKDCCLDLLWTREKKLVPTDPNNGPELLSELKTFIVYLLDTRNPDKLRNPKDLSDPIPTSRELSLKDFAIKYGLNVNIVATHWQDSHYAYAIPAILRDYEVNLEDLVKYIQNHPEKREELLSYGPGKVLPRVDQSTNWVDEFFKKKNKANL